MQSLLSRYYHRIKGSAEDIASDSFAYFLNESKSSNQAFNDFIFRCTNIKLPTLSFSSQIHGENGEIPDVSGFDSDYQEQIIIEAKFWASLTDNQPVTYLNRLTSNGILLFICPNQRIQTLSFELERRIRNAKLELELIKSDKNVNAYLLSNAKHLVVTTWPHILHIIRETIIQDNNRSLLSDLDQVIGLCESVDMDAMLPIRDEDLSPSIPRIIQNYYAIVDHTITELHQQNVIDIKGLKSTAQKYGYTRFFKTGDICGALEVHFQLWRYFGDTPIWIKFGLIEDHGKWNMQAAQLKRACKSIALQENYRYYENNYGEFYFALFPKTGQTEDVVNRFMVDQVIYLIDAIMTRI